MIAKTDQGDSKQSGIQKVEDFMKVYSKKDRKKELQIQRIEVTSDRLTGRAGLALFVTYLHQIELFGWLNR